MSSSLLVRFCTSDGGPLHTLLLLVFILLAGPVQAQLAEPLGGLVRAASLAPVQHEFTIATATACFDYAANLNPEWVGPDVTALAQQVPPYCLPTPAAPFAAIFRPFTDKEEWMPTSPDLLACGEGFISAGEALIGDDPYVFVASPRRLGTAFFLDYRGGTVALDAGGEVSDSTAGERLSFHQAYALMNFVCQIHGNEVAALTAFATWSAQGTREIWVHRMMYPKRARDYIREVYYSEAKLTREIALDYTYSIVGENVPIPDGEGGYLTDGAGFPVYELVPGFIQTIFPGYNVRREKDDDEQKTPNLAKMEHYSCVDEILDAVKQRSNVLNPRCEPFLACLERPDALTDPVCVSAFVADYASRTPCWFLPMMDEATIEAMLTNVTHPCYWMHQCTYEPQTLEPECQNLAALYVSGYLN